MVNPPPQKKLKKTPQCSESLPYCSESLPHCSESPPPTPPRLPTRPTANECSQRTTRHSKHDSTLWTRHPHPVAGRIPSVWRGVACGGRGGKGLPVGRGGVPVALF
jgi:hypothetical protein